MTITNKQEKEIKDELFKQLDNVPSESREQVRKQIESMTKDQIEEFVKNNQDVKTQKGEPSGCVFCTILEGKTPSIKVDENDDSIAILDINPISKGHTLIIPKKHEAEPNEKTQELAFKVGKKIFEELKPKDMTTRAAKVMNHTILNVVPIYEDTDIAKRIKVTQEELIDVAKKISSIKLIETKKEPEVIKEEKPKEVACVFCAIANKEMPSIEIDENKDNIAVLEINPVSLGHSLIIPKNHSETTNLPSNSFTLAKKIAKKIKSKFKPNDIKINPTSISNHSLIELIPIYDTTNPSKRQTTSQEELKETQKKLRKKKKAPSKNPKPKSQKKKASSIKIFKKPKRNYPNLPELPPRIP